MYASTGQDQTQLMNQAAADSSWSASDLPGLGDVGPEIPEEIDTPFFRDALANPRSRPYVLQILDDPDPVKAFDQQSEQDLSEAIHPTGKFIVFKSLVTPIAERMQDASEVLSSAAPVQDTPEGRVSAQIIAIDQDPESTLKDYYTHLALEAFDPDAYHQVISEHPSLGGLSGDSPYFGRDSLFAYTLGDLGLSKKWRKRLRRIGHIAEKVGVAVAAIAVTVATAGTAAAPILAAATTVAGVAGTALKTFGHTKRQKRLGGYLATGAAVEGAATSVVGAAGAVANVTGISSPSQNVNAAAPAASAPTSSPGSVSAADAASGFETQGQYDAQMAQYQASVDQSAPGGGGVPGAVTSLDQDAGSAGGAQPSPDDGQAIGANAPPPATDQSAVDQSSAQGDGGPSAGQILNAAGQVATATGKVAGALIQADQPASGEGTAAQQAAAQQAATQQAAMFQSMLPTALLGGGVLLLLVLGSGSGSGSRRNPSRGSRRRWRR
jgi:hypothetical protein